MTYYSFILQQNMEDESVNSQGMLEKPQKDVTFPTTKPKKGFNKLLLLIPLILLLAGGASYWLFFTKPSDTVNNSEITPTPIVQTSSTPTPEPVKKEDIQIQIYNGTGIPGEAALLKTRLEKLGYENIETANADSKDFTAAEVQFPENMDIQAMTEISENLEEYYNDVQVSSSGSGNTVKITTGIRKGYASPTPTKKPTASPTKSPTITGSITPTITPTPSPSVTPAV